MSWQTKKFEDCLEKVVYTNKIQRKDFLEYGDFPVISQEAEFINGYWNNEADVFKPIAPVVIFGDHTQVLKYVDFDFVLGADGVKILQPKKFLNSKFFYYFLQSIDLKSLGYARHYRLLKDIEIPMPPLAEQERIVKILDDVFEGVGKARENAEKNVKNSRELFESYLQNIFANPGKDWEEKRLEEVCEIKHGFAFKSSSFKTDFLGIDPIVLTPGNFKEDGGLIFNIKNTKRCFGKYPSDFKFKVGNLVVVMTDLSSKMKILGKPALIEDDNILHNQRIGKIMFKNDSLDKRFLYFYFLSNLFTDNIKRTATGTMVKHTAPKRILENIISFPKSLTEQKALVKKLDALTGETKKLQAIYRQKLADLDELKKSVLKKAFSGEL